MKPSVMSLVWVSLCVFIITMSGSAWGESAPSALLPPGVVISESYRPGVGVPVGQISQVSGKVAVLHGNDAQGYWAQSGNNLFKGDAIITLAGAFAAFKLQDGSFMTLSSETRLEITKSVYSPEKQSRSTFINMVAGKTRFIVQKLVEARHSEFKVKTTTSVAGVRGSDFIVLSADEITEVVALQRTELEIIGLAAPDATPTILHDFEKTTVRKGAIPEEARKVSAEEVDRLMKEFKFHPSETQGGAIMEQQEERSQGEDQSLQGNNIYEVLVRDEDLVKPDFMPEAMPDSSSLEDRFQARRRVNDEIMMEEEITTIHQQQSETIQKSSLPDFPGTP